MGMDAALKRWRYRPYFTFRFAALQVKTRNDLIIACIASRCLVCSDFLFFLLRFSPNRLPALFGRGFFLLLLLLDSGLELVPLKLVLIEEVFEQDDVDCGVEVCAAELVHLASPE
jgi:hypothetical protein